MRLLGISSATKVISFALLDEAKVPIDVTIAEANSEKLIFFLKEAGIKPDEIDAIAVASGPGSYSGLRGGLAAAKTLAQTLGKPLVSISTLEAMAYNLLEVEGTMAVILDARGEEYNFALFAADRGQIKRLTDDLVINLDQLIAKLAKITGKLYLLGSLEKIRPKIAGDNFFLVDQADSHPYGRNVARIGKKLIAEGKTDEPLKLTATYSHQPNFRAFQSDQRA